MIVEQLLFGANNPHPKVQKGPGRVGMEKGKAKAKKLWATKVSSPRRSTGLPLSPTHTLQGRGVLHPPTCPQQQLLFPASLSLIVTSGPVFFWYPSPAHLQHIFHTHILSALPLLMIEPQCTRAFHKRHSPWQFWKTGHTAITCSFCTHIILAKQMLRQHIWQHICFCSSLHHLHTSANG